MVKLFFTILVLCPTLAFAWTGTVTKIHDGDTITVNSTKIRLWGIDCPEYKQDYGREATEFVRRLLPIGATVEVDDIARDRYGRTVAIISYHGETVQADLLRAGLAWVYERYYKERGDNWPGLESEAKAARRGLWQDDNPVPPWTWRRMKK